MPVLTERVRLRRAIESLCVEELLLTERGIWISRQANVRYAIWSNHHSRPAVIVGGRGRLRTMNMTLIEAVVDAAQEYV